MTGPDQPENRGRTERRKPWENGTECKRLFDDFYNVILGNRTAAEAALRTLLSPRDTWLGGVKTEHVVDQVFTIPLGDSLWEVSGTLRPDGNHEELWLHKLDPRLPVRKPLEGFTVRYDIRPPLVPEKPEVVEGKATCWHSDKSFTDSETDRDKTLAGARELLKEFEDALAAA